MMERCFGTDDRRDAYGSPQSVRRKTGEPVSSLRGRWILLLLTADPNLLEKGFGFSRLIEAVSEAATRPFPHFFRGKAVVELASVSG
jgi:hypothetical protein